METETITVTLPARYARDWHNRVADDHADEWTAELHMASWKSRTATLTLDREALADLVSDVKHYTSTTMRAEYIAEGSRGIVMSADAARKRLQAAGLMD